MQEENNSLSMSPQKRNLWEKISFFSMIALVFLVPLFFLPTELISLNFSKILITAFFAILGFSAFLIGKMLRRELPIPLNLMSVSLIATLIFLFISAFNSPSFDVSFMGSGSSVWTLGFFIVLCLIFFTISLNVKTKDEIVILMVSLMLSLFLMMIFYVAFLFGLNGFVEKYIPSLSSSTIAGSIETLSILCGAFLIWVMATADILRVSFLVRLLLYFMGIVSIFVLGVLNDTFIWATVGVLSLIFCVYGFLFFPVEDKDSSSDWGSENNKKIKSKRIAPIHLFSLIVISVVFFLGSSTLGGALSKPFSEINPVSTNLPTLSDTLKTVKGAVAERPLLGTGPNRFFETWSKYRPIDVIQSSSWNMVYNLGWSSFLTMLSTSGVLTMLSFLAFFIAFLLYGIKNLFRGHISFLSKYMIATVFFIGLYFWFMFFSTTTSVVIFVFIFALSALLVSLLYSEKLLSFYTLPLGSDPKVGFVISIVCVALFIGSISIGISYGKRAVASVFFEKGIKKALEQGDIEAGERYVIRASEWVPRGSYFTALSEISLLRLNQAVATNERDAIQEHFDNARMYAGEAVTYDNRNFQFWLSVGRVNEAAVPLSSDDGAYKGALEAYNNALSLSPNNPSIHFVLSRLLLLRGDFEGAEGNISKALSIRPNYGEAYFLRSKIWAASSDLIKAKEDLVIAAVLLPQNPEVFYNLGTIYFNDEDYSSAVNELERAISISPRYANAYYFLGLSYYKLGDMDKSLSEFKKLRDLVPQNEEIGGIVSDLESGRDPVFGATNSDAGEAPVFEDVEN